MPALLTIVNNGNSDQGGRWRAGEAVNSLSGHVFGWFEIPKNFLGVYTVAQVNQIDITNQPIYSVVEMVDGGTITAGARSIDVNAGDAIVIQFDEVDRFWTNFGPRPSDEYNHRSRFHWRVSDKMPEEMAAYMESHHKEIEMEVTNGPDPQGFRRITITNLYLTASGNNSWTQEGIDDFIDEWNIRYPECNLQEYQPHTASEVFVEGTFTDLQASEFYEVVVQYGFSDLYARRRWYITPDGMTFLANNDGFVSTTAQELGPYFRDGLLD